MKKNNPYKCVFLLSIAIGLLIFFFKDRGHSDVPLEYDPIAIAINPETNTAVVVTEKEQSHSGNSGLVSVIDLSTQKAVASIPVGKQPGGAAIDRGLNLALITNTKDNTVSVINLNTLTLIRTIPVGKEPEGIAVNPDPETSSGHIALTANNKDDTVSVIDLNTLTVIKTIQVGKEPKDVAIDPELNLALVVNEKDYNVSVIDLRTYKVTGTVPVGEKPLAIDINPETHLAAVANEKDNSITVIDLKTWQTYTINACKHPIDIVINQLDNRALVLCDEDKTLLLIDLNTKATIKSYSLNKKPTAIAVNNFTNIAAVISEKTDSLTLIQLPNPIPEITSIAPDNTQRGGSDVTIGIEGNRFIKSSSASLKLPASDLSLLTSFEDNHHLEVTIPKEALLKAGTFPITVSNPSPEGGTSNSIGFTVNNPVPSITVLDPAEAMAGTAGLTLNIHGTGFFDDTKVYINNTQRTFTLISPTKLQIALLASDLETGAYLEITASNPIPGGGKSNTATFKVLNPVPSLTSITPTSIKAGSPDFTLTIAGNNFVKTSAISLNNKLYPARYISKTQIETTIPSDAVKTDGSYPVKAINPSPGGGEAIQSTSQSQNPLR